MFVVFGISCKDFDSERIFRKGRSWPIMFNGFDQRKQVQFCISESVNWELKGWPRTRKWPQALSSPTD